MVGNGHKTTWLSLGKDQGLSSNQQMVILQSGVVAWWHGGMATWRHGGVAAWR